MTVSLRKRGRILCDIWVCQCCMLMHANGECCPDDSHGGDGIKPWALIDGTGYAVTMGMLPEEHDEMCEDNYECDCEHDTFSSSRCGGCGSWLAGDRYAFTLWLD